MTSRPSTCPNRIGPTRNSQCWTRNRGGHQEPGGNGVRSFRRAQPPHGSNRRAVFRSTRALTAWVSPKRASWCSRGGSRSACLTRPRRRRWTGCGRDAPVRGGCLSDTSNPFAVRDHSVRERTACFDAAAVTSFGSAFMRSPSCESLLGRETLLPRPPAHAGLACRWATSVGNR